MENTGQRERFPQLTSFWLFLFVLSCTIDQGPCSGAKYSEEMVKNETCANMRLDRVTIIPCQVVPINNKIPVIFIQA